MGDAVLMPRSRLGCQLQQVLPVLTGRIGPIGLLDDGPIDFEFFRLFPQGVDEQVVERDSMKPKPPQEFGLGPTHPAGPHREDEKPAIGVGMLQPIFKSSCFGNLGRDLGSPLSGALRRGMPFRNGGTRCNQHCCCPPLVTLAFGFPVYIQPDSGEQSIKFRALRQRLGCGIATAHPLTDLLDGKALFRFTHA